MAKAPRPGVGRRADEVKAAKVVHRLRIGDETRTIAINNIPTRDRFAVRKATGGLPIEMFFGQDAFGIDSLKIIWWVAGRAAGRPDLTFAQVEEEWPEELTEDDIDFVEVTPDDEAGDDPQS